MGCRRRAGRAGGAGEKRGSLCLQFAGVDTAMEGETFSLSSGMLMTVRARMGKGKPEIEPIYTPSGDADERRI